MFRQAAWFSAFLIVSCGSIVIAQPAPMPDPMANPMPSVAATVNGYPIHETAVDRALQSVPMDERVKARDEVIQYLINNAIVDQYLLALKVTVDTKEIDQQLNTFKEELKKHEQDYALMLRRMKLTEAELRVQIENQLRWEKFVGQQASEEKLHSLFKHMPEAFDGTTIRARHILIPATEDPKSKLEAQTKLSALKTQIDKDVAAGMAKLPADADNLTKERQRLALLEDAFANAAKKNSTCQSAPEGGSLPAFPRYGGMIEPFAKAAYALRLFEISDVVVTPFGYHLIMVVGRKAGTPTKFEDPKVREAVKEVYEAKLKDAVLEQMKPRSKVEIVPMK